MITAVHPGLQENLGFKEKVFRLEHRTQNYDPDIHEEYLIRDTPIPCHIIYSHLQTKSRFLRFFFFLNEKLFLL